jgi:uncharacterized protein YjbJ (UPF0337 family)
LAGSETAQGNRRYRNWKGKPMDKDRIKGAVRQAKGTLKKAAGKLTGDTRLEAEGRAANAAGKVQSAVGGLKDALRETTGLGK